MDIIEVLDELGIEYKLAGEHHHATEGFAQVDCAFCSPGSGQFRMGISLEGTRAICWTCGTHRLGDALVEATNTPYQDLKHLLSALDVASHEAKARVGRLKLPKGLGPLLPAHRKYIRSRGFNPSVIERIWKVQGIGHLGGKLSWRIFIPMILTDRTVNWTTRSISDTVQRRYINAKKEHVDVPRTELLYGLDFVRWSIAIVEGPLDAWAIGPGAVATMGTSYSRRQFELMLRYPVRAVVFDNEPTAQRRAQKLVDELSAYEGETYRLVLDSKDAATAPKKDLVMIRKLIGA